MAQVEKWQQSPVIGSKINRTKITRTKFQSTLLVDWILA